MDLTAYAGLSGSVGDDVLIGLDEDRSCTVAMVALTASSADLVTISWSRPRGTALGMTVSLTI